MNYSPFIYAFEQQNIAITGEGTLDGQADNTHWWPWKGSADFGWTTGAPNYNAARQRLLDMGERGVPVSQRVFGDGDYIRPNFIQPYRCRNILIEGVTIVGVADVGDPSRALSERHGARRDDQQPRPEQRRLRPGVVPGRAHRSLRVRHRRRLHRDQVGTQRRRTPRQRAEREHHRPQLRDARRARRRHDRQRDLRRLLERVRARLPNGQPQARPRAAAQEQRDARRRAPRHLHARCHRWTSRRLDTVDRLLL